MQDHTATSEIDVWPARSSGLNYIILRDQHSSFSSITVDFPFYMLLEDTGEVELHLVANAPGSQTHLTPATKRLEASMTANQTGLGRPQRDEDTEPGLTFPCVKHSHLTSFPERGMPAVPHMFPNPSRAFYGCGSRLFQPPADRAGCQNYCGCFKT